MAISASSVKRDRFPRQYKLTVTDITMDNSYPTGGEAVTAAQLGLQNVDVAWCNIKTTATTAVAEPWFDVTNMKLKINAAAAEFANGGDLTNVVVTVFALGY